MAFGGEILTGKWHTGGSQELEMVYVLIRVVVTQVYIYICKKSLDCTSGMGELYCRYITSQFFLSYS